jgi:hypothetical protein
MAKWVKLAARENGTVERGKAPERLLRVRQMQGRKEEETGGVYDADIRRGLPTTENVADGVL